MFLNLDAGELGEDVETEELWSLFDVLNCACGGHAGDLDTMSRVARFCANSATRLGAHPAYPDRASFGRTTIAIDPAQLASVIGAQCGALAGIARELGVPIGSMKPHGALYHDAARNPAIAEAVLHGATAALGTDVLVIGPRTGALRDAAIARGLRYAIEGFADRRLRSDGSIVPRTEPNALITDPIEAAQQARSLSDVDTICVHADTPNALAIARAVRESLR